MRAARKRAHVRKPRKRYVLDKLRELYGPTTAAQLVEDFGRVRTDDAMRAAFDKVKLRAKVAQSRRFKVRRRGKGKRPPTYTDLRTGAEVSYANVKRSLAMERYWESLRLYAAAHDITLGQARKRISGVKREEAGWRGVIVRGSSQIRELFKKARKKERRNAKRRREETE